MTRSSLRSCAVLTAVVAVAAVSGCASAAKHTAASNPSMHVVGQLHDELPASVRKSGVLRVVTDASYAPASSFAPDGRTIIGFEPDLGAALGQVLGVKIVFRNADFSKLPALVSTGKADLIMSAMTDTAAREKLVDFVDYFQAGTALVVQRGNPHSISDLASLCGRKVAVESGTVQVDLLRREQTQCGSKRITVLKAPTNDDALLLLRTGRAAALPMDYPPAEDLTTAESTGANYQLASTSQYEPGPYGIGVAKNRTDLRDAVQQALARIIKSGTYRAVLKKWSVTSGAVSQALINAAGVK